jgi:hypothetical protein
MTAAARERFAESFLEGHACKVCPQVTLAADLLPAERARRAEALRRAHYARVALASAQSRAKKKRAAVVSRFKAHIADTSDDFERDARLADALRRRMNRG